MRVEKELVLLKKISASPCTIQYWSEEGLRLYHALAEKDTLFWDATGIVVRKGDDSMRMRIPVSAMLTDDQSLPSVQDWIARFRHDEKKLFGHSNICQPKLIISYESWVFIIAALKEFNTESLKDFLQRA